MPCGAKKRTRAPDNTLNIGAAAVINAGASGIAIRGGHISGDGPDTLRFALGAGSLAHGSADTITGMNSVTVDSGSVRLDSAVTTPHLAVNGGTLTINGGQVRVGAGGRGVASHLFGDEENAVKARVLGQAGGFRASGSPLKRDALTLGTSLTGQWTKTLWGFADAAYEYRGSGQDAYQLTVGLRKFF